MSDLDFGDFDFDEPTETEAERKKRIQAENLEKFKAKIRAEERQKLANEMKSKPIEIKEVIPKPETTMNWFKVIGGVFATLFLLLVLVAAAMFVWKAWSVDPPIDPKPETTVEAPTNPGEFYIFNLAHGLAKSCDEIIEKANNGEFKDFGEVEKAWIPMQQKAREKSLVPFKAEVFDELNGSKFTNEKTAELWTMLKEGYLEALK